MIVFRSGTVEQKVLGLLFSFGSFAMYVGYSPYISREDDVLSTVCQVQIFFSLLASIVLRAQQCLFRSGHATAAHSLRTLGNVLVGADFGKVVALLEVPVNQTPRKTDFHYAYPYTVEGKKIGFLEEFADIGELTSDPKVRTGVGRITAQPLQTVMPEFDRLRGNRFMAAGR